MAPARHSTGILAACALAAVAAPAGGRGEARPWYVPDHGKLQLAGNIGFLSPGFGYAWGRRLEGDVFLGWVPEAIGGTEILCATGKVTWKPWAYESRGWWWRPFTAALQLTYTFGEQYDVDLSSFYATTAVRSGVGVGTEVGRRLRARSVAVYCEVVALDVGLAYWLTDPRTLGPEDVFSLALGARVEF